MNRLAKVRDRAGSALGSARDGTKRTTGWVKDGAAAPFRKLRASGSDATAGARDAVSGAIDRSGGSSFWRRARSNGGIAAAVVVGVLLLIAWIAWTVYVWNENGANAGLGVLISVPGVIAVLALVIAPFAAAAIAARRTTGDGRALATAEEPAAEKKPAEQ